MTTPLTEPTLVLRRLDATDKLDAIRQLASRLASAGRVSDLGGFLRDVEKREEQLATGLPGGIAIPHCRSGYVTAPSVAIGISAAGVDFGAGDGPARLIFLIAAPDGADQAHLAILAALARRLIHVEFRDALANAATDEDVAAILNKEVEPK